MNFTKMMEPSFTLDINDDGNQSPRFHPKYTINSTVQGLNDAANRAELVSIDPKLPNFYLYDILRILKNYSTKPNILWWAKSLDLYHRLWATEPAAEYPNALILGAILCVSDCLLDKRVLGFLFGMNLEILQEVVEQLENASRNIIKSEFTGEYFLELACAYFNVDEKTAHTAHNHFVCIEQSVQLLPIGATESHWLACLGVFFASLETQTPIEAISCAQFATLPLTRFTDLCDYLWCDQPQLASSYDRQTYWYFDHFTNLNTVIKLCEESGVDCRAATTSASRIPQGLFRNGRRFVALALLGALEIPVPDPVAALILKTANRSPKQLATWIQQIKQYLK